MTARRRTVAGRAPTAGPSQPQGIASSILETFPTFIWRARSGSIVDRRNEDIHGTASDVVELRRIDSRKSHGEPVDCAAAARRAASLDYSSIQQPQPLAHRAQSCSNIHGRERRVKRKPAPSTVPAEAASECRVTLQTTCPICTEDFASEETLRLLPCAGEHSYHAACIDEWLSQHRSCPLCRQDLQPEEGEAAGADAAAASSAAASAPAPAPSQPAAAQSPRSDEDIGVNEALRSEPASSPETRPSTSTSWKTVGQRFEEYRARKRARRQQARASGSPGSGAVDAPPSPAIPHAVYVVASAENGITVTPPQSSSSAASPPPRRLWLLRWPRSDDAEARPPPPPRSSRPRRPPPMRGADDDYQPRRVIYEREYMGVSEHGAHFMPFM